MKKTVVLGASDNPERYAYLATKRLKMHGHEVLPIGIKPGMAGETPIQVGTPAVEGVDTVTMYLGAARQPAYYDYILSLHPKRIIFNPGAENPELAVLAAKEGIEVVEGCTLVMLSIGNY
jgi:uncharacterized protein